MTRFDQPGEGGYEPSASGVSHRVQTILEAAEQAARDIRYEAEMEKRRMTRESDRRVAEVDDGLRRMAAVADALVERADELRRQVDEMIGALRRTDDVSRDASAPPRHDDRPTRPRFTGAGPRPRGERRAAEPTPRYEPPPAAAQQSASAQQPDLAQPQPPHEHRPAHAQQPQSEHAPQQPAPQPVLEQQPQHEHAQQPQPESAQQPQPVFEQQPRPAYAQQPDPAPVPHPEPASQPQRDHPQQQAAAAVGLDAERLVAMQMALAGRSREEAADRLVKGFGLQDPAPILDEVFG